MTRAHSGLMQGGTVQQVSADLRVRPAQSSESIGAGKSSRRSHRMVNKMIMTTEQKKEFILVVWNYLKSESVCVSCKFIAGVKFPLQFKKPIILCSYPGQPTRTYLAIPGIRIPVIRECHCLPIYSADGDN
jgi:hypothetical protein